MAEGGNWSLGGAESIVAWPSRRKPSEGLDRSSCHQDTSPQPNFESDVTRANGKGASMDNGLIGRIWFGTRGKVNKKHYG